MRKTCFNKAMTIVVAMLSFTAVSSCVDAKYELSEERLNSEVTLFQEGLSLPLGKTVPITLDELYSKLDPEMQEMLSNKGGAYGFRFDGSYDLSDSLGFIKEMADIDKVEVNEKFSFDLSNVNLDGVEFKAQSVSPDPIEIYSMLEIPMDLPDMSQKVNFSAGLPDIEAESLNLDFGQTDMSGEVEFASLGSHVQIPEDISKYLDPDAELSYQELVGTLPFLPPMTLATDFDLDFSVPVEITLPNTIKSVNSIQLDDNANVEMNIAVENPLFTSGSIVPKITLDLSKLFCIAGAQDGIVKDEFTLSADNNWQAGKHVYHVDSLMINKGMWKPVGDNIVLSEEIAVNISGVITQDDLKTTLNHLKNCSEPMTVVMDMKFNDFVIENVKVELNPITVEQSVELPLDVNVEVPEAVKTVDYIAMDLGLGLSASLPETFKSLDMTISSLDISFPEEFKVNHDSFDQATGTLSYNDISLKGGLEDKICIERVTLPAPGSDGKIAYSGDLNIKTVARIGGVINSRDIINSASADISIAVDCTPSLTDYSVTIDDYPYEIEVDPIVIEESLPSEVGKMKEVTVYLENDPVIEINLNYPSADGVISIIPDKTEGLKISFPKMIRFKNLSSDYGYQSSDNSINFTQNIPNTIKLPIDCLVIEPSLVEGTEDKYCVKGEMKVEGGVCLKGTTITKSVVDALIREKASVSFKADIPELKPSTLAIDEYVASIDHTIEIKLDQLAELPDMVKSIDALDLNEVYLNLMVDASEIASVIDDVDLTLDMDVKLPKIIKVKNAQEGNVVSVNGKLDKDNKIEIEPVHIIGLDLSEVDFSQGSIDLGNQNVEIKGNIKLSNVSVDIDKLADKDLQVAVSGNLATNGKETIEIQKISAKVDYHLDPVDKTISLEELTEGLGDNLDFELHLRRYHLDIDLKTNLALPVEADLSIIPYFDGKPDNSRVIGLVDPLVLNWNENPADTSYTKIRISNSELNKIPGRQHVILDLLSLIQDMPDSIQVHIEAGTQENAKFIIYPGSDYVLKADYAFEMPLEFGEDFMVEYADTMAISSDYSKMMASILSSGTFGLTGKVTSGLPLQLELTVNLMDADHNIIKMKDGAGKLLINRGNLDGTAVVTDLNMIMGLDKSDSGIPEIAAIELRLLVSTGGMTGAFMENASIQVELAALIPEGVTVNLKEIKSSANSESVTE